MYGKHYYPDDAVMSLADADIKLREDLPEARTSIRWNLKAEQQRQKHKECRQQRKPKRRSHDNELEFYAPKYSQSIIIGVLAHGWQRKVVMNGGNMYMMNIMIASFVLNIRY